MCAGIIVFLLLRAFFLSLHCRQRTELEDLRRQLEENNSLAGRALREELDKTREEQQRRHQVMSVTSVCLCQRSLYSLHT